MKKISALFIATWLSGCATLLDPPDPHLLAEIRGDDAGSTQTGGQAMVDILALSPELKLFVDENIDRRWHGKKRLQALRGILFSPDMFDIEYQSGDTKTAIETYESRSGNCLSMTSLFIAMARYSGLDAQFHLVTARPEWDQSGNTLIWTQHINSTGVLRNGDRYVLDFLPQLRAIREEMETVSDEYALAIYYNNLGAEAIVNKRLQKALEYLRLALRIEPRMANVWNNMGATQKRLKRADLAKASFQQAIILDAYNSTAMSNLSRIYFAEGDEQRGEYFARRVSKYRNRNPYYRYANARTALQAKDYARAREELVAAIILKNDEADFFDALAEVYEGLGDSEKQLLSLRMAKLTRGKSNTRRSSLEIYRTGNVVIK
jgi:Flp pilus assembly protein TadD